MTSMMTLAITDCLWFGLISLSAYLLGSICTAIFVCRLFGLADPRSTGSSNPGATNVMRLGGKLPALLTFLGDALKGVPPILLAYGMGLPLWMVGLIGVFALLGHIYPVFFGFAGGKGVATAFGVLLGLDWRLCVGALLSWAIVFALTRVSSLASLISFVVLVPIFAYIWQMDLLPALSLMGLLILWRHRQNIADLMQGKERGCRQSKS
jgi:glycerol-3-phosphate acyltransferase PlsY